MALAFSAVTTIKAGNMIGKVVDVTFDNSYPTGGEAVTAANFGLAGIVHIPDCLGIVTTSAYAIHYDATNAKLMVFQGDNDNGADAPFVEANSTRDLSNVVARVTAWGY